MMEFVEGKTICCRRSLVDELETRTLCPMFWDELDLPSCNCLDRNATAYDAISRLSSGAFCQAFSPRTQFTIRLGIGAMS